MTPPPTEPKPLSSDTDPLSMWVDMVVLRQTLENHECALRAMDAVNRQLKQDKARLDWLERVVRWDDATNTAWVDFGVPTVKHCTVRDAIDAAMCAKGNSSP